MRARQIVWIGILALSLPGGARAKGRNSDESRSLGKRPGSTAKVPEADFSADGFPVWLGQDRKADRVVVLVEGFDLNNSLTAKDLLGVVYPAAERLMASGMDLLVVDFPDSHLAPDELAPSVERAVRAAKAIEGVRQIDVVGLSGGGMAARWALSAAEAGGNALPVRSLILFDCPNRGARLHPALQALALKYGGKRVTEALSSGSVRALVAERPAEVAWEAIGPPLPGGRRKVPTRCAADGSGCAAFLARLHALNDRRGYPKSTRVVAVAQGSRTPNSSGGDLYHMWLPFGAEWTLPLAGADCVPGSLLPESMSKGFRIKMPLGLAGAYLRTVPTFIPTETSLDASATENPPFDAWYARPNGATPIAHSAVDPDAVAFVVKELLRP